MIQTRIRNHILAYRYLRAGTPIKRATAATLPWQFLLLSLVFCLCIAQNIQLDCWGDKDALLTINVETLSPALVSRIQYSVTSCLWLLKSHLQQDLVKTIFIFSSLQMLKCNLQQLCFVNISSGFALSSCLQLWSLVYNIQQSLVKKTLT